MSSTEVSRFFYDAAEVRVVQRGDGEPWFVLADLCAVLGLTNPAVVARRIDDADKGVSQIYTPGGKQSATVVNESGMYEAVLRSDKPEAVQVRRWITKQVLPALRRTGTYTMPGAALDPSTPDGMRLIIEAASNALAELEVARPKAEAWDSFANADGDYSVNDAAKILARDGIETGQTRLFDTLHAINWIYRRNGRWHARQLAVDNGYMQHRAQSHEHPSTGERVVDAPQVRITPRGLRRLRERLKQNQEIAP